MGDAMNADAPRAFRYLRRTTLVSTEADAHLQWLCDCLEPHFRSSAPDHGDWRVASSVDPDRFRELMERGAHAGRETVPFFALDSRIVALPRWNADDPQETLAFDEEFDVLFTVRRGLREVDVLAREPRPWRRVALLRVVRELAMEDATHANGVLLHAAAFERDGVTYVIAGPKNAGKTTLLIHALTSAPSRFIANDRALLIRSTEGYAVRGMPTLVNVRARTRRFFAGLFDAQGFGPDSACLTREERQFESRSVVDGSGEALTLNPRQFVDALQTTSSIGSRLGAILFPVVSATAEGVKVDELPPSAAREALVSALLPTLARCGRPTVFGGAPADASTERTFLSDVAAQRIPLLRCALGPKAYDRDATAWLDEIERRTRA